jgi:copper chaperone CopZ
MAKGALLVEGMTCGNCVKHVTKAVSSQPSVSDVKVEIGRVDFTYDPGTTSLEKVAAAIEDAGYCASPEMQAS